MKKLTTLLFIALGNLSFSQSTPSWSEDFEVDVANYYAEFPEIKNLSDTLTVIGIKNTSSGQRLQLVNYNLLGDTISTISYGNDSVSNNLLIDYTIDLSDNIYILQQEEISFNKHKIVLQKYTSDGSLIWVEQVQNVGDTSYVPQSLGLANDTCLFVTSHKEHDYPMVPGDVVTTVKACYLFAFNADGNQMWQREFDPINEVYWFNHDIFIHENAAFLFVSSPTSTYGLIKVDANNVLTSNQNTGLVNGLNDVQLTPDTMLLIASQTSYRISKTDLNGNLIWTKYYGTNLPSNVHGDEIKAITQDSLGNIYVTGRHYGDEYGAPNYSNADILTIKYDIDGNIIWENRFENGINNADIGNAITLKLGNVYVGGQSQRNGVGTDYDYLLLKIDSISGALAGDYLHNGANDGDDIISSLCVLPNADIAITGLSSINLEFDWTTQLISDLTLDVNELANPLNKELVKIVDMLGRETKFAPNQALIYIYKDGTTEKVYTIE